MICPNCGKDNQAHFKFCLGCGSEVGDASAGPPKATPRTTSPSTPVVMAEPSRAAASVEAASVTDPSMPTFTDPSAAPRNGGGPSTLCTTCSTMVAPGFRFCPTCGSPVAQVAASVSHTGAVTAMPDDAPKAAPEAQGGRLVMVRPDGSEGGTHDLAEGENAIGRATGALFDADGYLSPLHAELVLNAAGAVVRDVNSLNGVFVKLTGQVELQDGDIFRIGQELLRFDAIGAPEPLEDGTEVLGSPNPGYWGRLAMIVGREQDGAAWPLMGDAVTLGRERGDITFPEDGYVSGTHARVSLEDGHYWLSDMNSSNGTFMKIRGERALPTGSHVLLGQQLFRVTY